MPYLALLCLFVFRKWKRRPDEHVISTIDWLMQQTVGDKLKSPMKNIKKGVKITWLTGQGVYVRPHRFLSWSDFSGGLLQELPSANDNHQTVRLKLLLKAPRTTTRQLTYYFFALCVVVEGIGTYAFFFYFHHYGLRDDVLALLFAILASVSFQAEMYFRYYQQRWWEKLDLSVLFNEQQIGINELHEFLLTCLPQGAELEVLKR